MTREDFDHEARKLLTADSGIFMQIVFLVFSSSFYVAALPV